MYINMCVCTLQPTSPSPARATALGPPSALAAADCVLARPFGLAHPASRPPRRACGPRRWLQRSAGPFGAHSGNARPSRARLLHAQCFGSGGGANPKPKSEIKGLDEGLANGVNCVAGFRRAATMDRAAAWRRGSTCGQGGGGAAQRRAAAARAAAAAGDGGGGRPG